MNKGATFYKPGEIKDPNGSVEVEKRVDKLLNYKVVPSQSQSVKKSSKTDRVLTEENQKLMKPDTYIVKRLLSEETDERYKYLLKHGIIHYIESQT